MKKKNIIILIIVLVVLALLLIFGLPYITGDVVSFSSVERGNYMCEDSDGDLDVKKESIFVKGEVVKSSSNGWSRAYEDKCVGKTKVREYFCTRGANVELRAYYCSNGCVDAACVKA